MERLWETDSFIDDNTLTVNVNRLRKKLDAAGLPDFIATRFGVGYLIPEGGLCVSFFRAQRQQQQLPPPLEQVSAEKRHTKPSLREMCIRDRCRPARESGSR